ncbi:hypothetical protein [Erwinia persicina]|nr:hypothetical protein [Erwinia persicina]MBD8109119.1 hypothetical protein [Erwinia persicina]MBD8170103.1 hypothetical protein [Erwinia persicina]MBD8212243.1 hypothetical protein [Erwinia persicina]
MMSDLDALKNTLAAVDAESDFLLEQRTARERLENIIGYAKKIPFASNENASWDSFWLGQSTAAELATLYQSGGQETKYLPVQQTFLLALLQLLETPTLLLNTLPARHRSLYYRDLLGFRRKGLQPDSVVVSFTLVRNSTTCLLPAGTALDGGQDGAGNALTYLTDDNLVVSSQQLSQLRWTRQKDSVWQLCTALDTDNNISLPEDGIRLFSATDNETVLQQTVALTLPLAGLQGDIQVETTLADGENGELTIQLVSDAGPLTLQKITPVGQTAAVYRLASETLLQAKKSQPLAWRHPRLALRSAAGQVSPASLSVRVVNCQDIRYRAQDGAGHIDTFSYPFGVTPLTGNAFELSLPPAFVKSGGELTIQPQWINLPPQSFAQWYAGYTSPPADNGVYTVQVYRLGPDGAEPVGATQPLFSGAGIPQGEVISVTLPAEADATTGLTLRMVLGSPDFLHADFQQEPGGKNVPWTPQVSRINTRFQSSLAPTSMGSVSSRLRTTAATGQAIWLGFSGVSPGDTLSLYWSLDAPSSLDLRWYAWAGEWLPLEAGLQDGTGGLSASGLWRAVLPEAALTGSDSADFSEEIYWIKAMQAEGQTVADEDLPKLKAMVAGAITATLDDAVNIEDDHFTLGLAAGTISQLVNPQAAISAVSQPLASTGGRAPETETAMMQRAAARIAHRQRAISWGNMRSMLLDNYPQLFDVQFPDQEKLNHIPALEIQSLLAIPNGRYRDNDDALRPTLSTGRLANMKNWLTQFTGPWASPELVNPTYVDVTARYRVIFVSGVGSEYGYAQLAVWLQQQYMPWGDDRQLAVTPGNQVDYYQLIATIQQSPLVQRVVSLTLARDGGETVQQSLTAGENEVFILIPATDSE